MADERKPDADEVGRIMAGLAESATKVATSTRARLGEIIESIATHHGSEAAAAADAIGRMARAVGGTITAMVKVGAPEHVWQTFALKLRDAHCDITTVMAVMAGRGDARKTADLVKMFGAVIAEEMRALADLNALTDGVADALQAAFRPKQ